MKRLLRVLFVLTLVGMVIYLNGGIETFFKASTVRAFGSLFVDFHVPPGAQIFNIANMTPGTVESRTVDVTNSGTDTRVVSVKGVKTSFIGASLELSAGLDLIIFESLVPIYGTGSGTGAKTLADFFTDSTAPNGVSLSSIGPGGHNTYSFQVTFPDGAGNEYQAKSVVFDLTFGIILGNNLVINEVYYQVDSSHGSDSPKDRGVPSPNVSGSNTLTGPGSTNIVKIIVNTSCNIVVSNNSTVINNIQSNSNTGNNTSNGNTLGGLIRTGAATAVVNVVNIVNSNQIVCDQGQGPNNEWIEIYNPTDHDISLKNWTLTDNTNNALKINANKIIKAGGFALISKNTSTWNFWNTGNALRVETGNQIGDGLDNSGDHVILKNPQKTEVDRMSWGTDTSGFTPSTVNPQVEMGASTERIVVGFDTNAASDWTAHLPPTPGH